MLGAKAPKRKNAAEVTLKSQLGEEERSLKSLRNMAPETFNDNDDLYDSRDFGESSYSINSQMRIRDDGLTGANSSKRLKNKFVRTPKDSVFERDKMFNVVSS